MFEESGPLSGEIRFADDVDGVGKLLLDGRRRNEHNVNDEDFDLFPIFRVDLVNSIVALKEKLKLKLLRTDIID